MRIGKFDKRITFERPASSEDANGDPVATWEPIVTVWAWVMSTGGQEVTEMGRVQGMHTWKLRTRYRSDITTKDRINHGGKLLYISSISHDDTLAKETTYLCTEYQA